MRDLGARRCDGVWRYDGEPVVLKILIRTEDQRRRVGDSIANRLAEIGFRVERIYRTADPAASIWLSQPPRAGGWHISISKWIQTRLHRTSGGNFRYYYTPAGRSPPSLAGV